MPRLTSGYFHTYAKTSTPIKRCSFTSPDGTWEPPPKKMKQKQNPRTKKPMQPINIEEHIPTREIQTWISNEQFALLNEDCQILLNPV